MNDTQVGSSGGHLSGGERQQKRVEIAEHMRYLPMGYFNENSLGQITSVTTNVMENLENVATRVVMLVCEGMLTTDLIIVMLLFFDWRIALVLLAGFILFLYANTWLQKAAGKLAGKKIDADERLVEKVLEYLQGMAEVKAYHLTGQKSRELNDAKADRCGDGAVYLPVLRERQHGCTDCRGHGNHCFYSKCQQCRKM